MAREKNSVNGALLFCEKMFSLKHFVNKHENVLSIGYVNPPKDIKSSYFRKVTAVNWCNVIWLMVEDATTKSYFASTERKNYQGI